MDPQINNFYESNLEPNRSCLLALRSILLNYNSEISEDWKYGMPCFILRSKHFCYLWIDKKTSHPYILFVDGAMIEHPLLEKGDRARMKIMRINPNEDIPMDDLIDILNLMFELRNS